MNLQPPRNFVDFFRSSFVYFALVASLASSFAVLVTRPTLRFEKFAVENEIQNNVEPERERQMKEFDFTVCNFGRGEPDLMEVADAVGDVLMTVLFLLPALAVLILANVLSWMIPGLHTAEFRAVLSVAFVYYTSYYWLTLGYLIYNPSLLGGSWRGELKIPSILEKDT